MRKQEELTYLKTSDERESVVKPQKRRDEKNENRQRIQ
jgi:hypothetical protein